MWWHRCDSLKCLLCLWKGLWTNECELLATPAYKHCICVRQWKGPTSGMGDGASAFGMWYLGERAGAEQMQFIWQTRLAGHQQTSLPRNQECKSTPFFQTWVFVFGSGEKVCWSVCKFFFCASVCQYFHPVFLSVATPSLFSTFSPFHLCNYMINGERGGLAWRLVFQWPL